MKLHSAGWRRTFFAFFALFVVCNVAKAESSSSMLCESNVATEHDYARMTILLVDRSDIIVNPSNLALLLQGLKEEARNAKQGERLVIEVITGKGTETRMLMDRVTPAHSIFKSTMKIRKQEKTYSECIDKVGDFLLQKSESYKTSAILETISYASRKLQTDSAPQKRFIVFSDMVQNTALLNFYHIHELPASEDLVRRVEKENLLPAISGAEIYVAGIGGNISDSAARKVESFWRSYFTRAGGNLKYYGPALTEFR